MTPSKKNQVETDKKILSYPQKTLEKLSKTVKKLL
jgi:hypothetical protein